MNRSKKFQLSVLLGVLPGLPLLAVSAPSSAATTGHAGSDCSREYDYNVELDQIYRVAGVYRYVGNALSFASAICPLEVDTAKNIAAVRVYYVDNNASDNVVCNLSRRTASGASLSSSIKVSPAGSSPGAKVFSFGSQGVASGFATLECNIPKPASGGTQGYSEIISYSVSQ